MATVSAGGGEAVGASVADARQVLKLWLAKNGDGQQRSPQAAAAAVARVAATRWQQERPAEAEFELRISTAGKLGLSLGPVDTEAGQQLLQVVAVAAGGAAEQAAAAAAQRLRAGLVVAEVMGRPVLSEAPSAIMGMIKAAGRPVLLTLRPHPDDDGASGGRTEGRQLVVLSDLPLVHSHLRHPRFRVLPLREWDGSVAQLFAEEVDVLFVGRHIADFQALPSTLLVNQFVGESCVTSKLLVQEMLLRNTADRARPAWLPEQYVVPDQRVALLRAWDRRQAHSVELAEANRSAAAGGLRNSWIVRSGWGARSEGVWVTDSRARLVELAEAAEAKKQKWVVSRYVAAPALVDSCKFDLRFYVAVRRAGTVEQSPEIFIHKEFYCRRAIDRYSGFSQRHGPKQNPAAKEIAQPAESNSPAVDQAFPATEHLTVHCYSEDADARAGQVFYSATEFRCHWANDHEHGSNAETRDKTDKDECSGAMAHETAHDAFGPELASIRRAIAELFTCAACEMGDPDLWPSSRGLYGIDVMLECVQGEHQRHQTQQGANGVHEREVALQRGVGNALGATTGTSLSSAYSVVILEANFSPDATRMLQYHPTFYDEVFDCLFLNPDACAAAAMYQKAKEGTDRLGTGDITGSVGSQAFLPLHPG